MGVRGGAGHRERTSCVRACSDVRIWPGSTSSSSSPARTACDETRRWPAADVSMDSRGENIGTVEKSKTRRRAGCAKKRAKKKGILPKNGGTTDTWGKEAGCRGCTVGEFPSRRTKTSRRAAVAGPAGGEQPCRSAGAFLTWERASLKPLGRVCGIVPWHDWTWQWMSTSRARLGPWNKPASRWRRRGSCPHSCPHAPQQQLHPNEPHPSAQACCVSCSKNSSATHCAHR